MSTCELLQPSRWPGSEERSRGRRPPRRRTLTREATVDAAPAIVHDGGPDALTMRAVAATLEVLIAASVAVSDRRLVLSRPDRGAGLAARPTPPRGG